tara:strand:- start:1169 stop:2320 length:1152 start_codon:yes stop_codon:yes gene_type:complete
MKKIAIIGAGISGLFFANLLRQKSGFDISIYEKNNSINIEKGYGIQLSVNSVNLLNKIGFKNINITNKFNPKKVDFYSLIKSKKICDLDISIFNSNDAKYTTLQRSSLIDFLHQKLPSNLIQYNKSVIKIKETAKNIILIFEDNSKLECDYLVISDGVFSSTKSIIANKKIEPIYSKSIAIRGTINKYMVKNIDYNNISLFLGSNFHSVIYPLDKGNELNFIGILEKKLNKIQMKDYSLFNERSFISSIMGELSNQIDQNILKNIKNIKCFPIYISKEIYKTEHKNIFLIGDAFFALPPTLAQGASKSIDDAYELYKNLENNNNFFLKKRIKKIKMINKRSKINYFAFHLSSNQLTFVRDIIMKYLIKNKKFINTYLGKIYKD